MSIELMPSCQMCRKLSLVLMLVSGFAWAGPMHAQSDSNEIVIKTPPVQAAVLTDRFGGVRASVNDFAHTDGGELTRRSLSDDERREMRRQIDEAIRKAYPRRRHQD